MNSTQNMNIPFHQNINKPQVTPMNLFLFNPGITPLPISSPFQLNMQLSQNIINNRVSFSIENLDFFTLQNLLSEHQFTLQAKNNFLNSALIFYLMNYVKIIQMNKLGTLKQIINLLLQFKANPNIRLRLTGSPINNSHAIFHIVEKNDIELVKYFLDNGADINVLDGLGRNCLYYLLTVPYSPNNLIDRKPICSLLLTRGIKINVLDDNGISPMMEAVKKGYVQIMDMLIKFGGDVNLINSVDGNTAVHYAIKARNREALWILLGKGNGDLYIKNHEGKTPLDLGNRLNNESNKDIYLLINNYANLNKQREKEDEKLSLELSGDASNSVVSNSDQSAYNKQNSSNINSNQQNQKPKCIADEDKLFVLQKEEVSSRIEIPFAFQSEQMMNNNFNDTDSASSNNTTNSSNYSFPFSSFIKIQNTPVLYLDISEPESQQELICESLKSDNENLGALLTKKDHQLENLRKEEESLKTEKSKLEEEYKQKFELLNKLKGQLAEEEKREKNKALIEQNQIEQTDYKIQELLTQFKKLEYEFEEENLREKDNENGTDKSYDSDNEYLVCRDNDKKNDKFNKNYEINYNDNNTSNEKIFIPKQNNLNNNITITNSVKILDFNSLQNDENNTDNNNTVHSADIDDNKCVNIDYMDEDILKQCQINDNNNDEINKNNETDNFDMTNKINHSIDNNKNDIQKITENKFDNEKLNNDINDNKLNDINFNNEKNKLNTSDSIDTNNHNLNNPINPSKLISNEISIEFSTPNSLKKSFTSPTYKNHNFSYNKNHNKNEDSNSSFKKTKKSKNLTLNSSLKLKEYTYATYSECLSPKNRKNKRIFGVYDKERNSMKSRSQKIIYNPFDFIYNNGNNSNNKENIEPYVNGQKKKVEKSKKDFYPNKLNIRKQQTQKISMFDLEKKYYDKEFSNKKLDEEEVYKNLTIDLIDWYNYCRINFESRKDIINKMIITLKNDFIEDSDIRLYGSYATNTSMIWSEVDLLILPKYDKSINTPSEFLSDFTRRLSRRLESADFTENVQVLKENHVISPVIKVETNINNQDIIYNLFVLDVSGIEDQKQKEDNSLINSVEMTKIYEEKYGEGFQIILVAIKQILFFSNLISNYSSLAGGISSYAIQIMLMSYLDKNEIDFNKTNYGKVFVDFLREFGNYDIMNRQIICLEYNNNGHSENNEEIKFLSSTLMTDIVVDPFNIRNNLIGKTSQFQNMKLTFMIAISVLRDPCECSCHYNPEMKIDEGKSHCLLNRIFNTAMTISRLNSGNN